MLSKAAAAPGQHQRSRCAVRCCTLQRVLGKVRPRARLGGHMGATPGAAGRRCELEFSFDRRKGPFGNSQGSSAWPWCSLSADLTQVEHIPSGANLSCLNQAGLPA